MSMGVERSGKNNRMGRIKEIKDCSILCIHEADRRWHLDISGQRSSQLSFLARAEALGSIPVTKWYKNECSHESDGTESTLNCLLNGSIRKG